LKMKQQTNPSVKSVKKEIYSEYGNRILAAFPEKLRTDVEAVISILPFEIDAIKLVDGKMHQLDNLIHPSTYRIELDNEQLIIPYRLYFNEPDIAKENTLTDIQKTILNCIYLRHHDGYLRQRRLEELIDKTEPWIIPFTLQLLGEYVLEILQVLDKHINTITIGNYFRIVKENQEYWQKTESRMISYWNEYYRFQFPKLKYYPGRLIADRIKKYHDLTDLNQKPQSSIN
jgi:hypothetical protein